MKILSLVLASLFLVLGHEQAVAAATPVENRSDDLVQVSASGTGIPTMLLLLQVEKVASELGQRIHISIDGAPAAPSEIFSGDHAAMAKGGRTPVDVVREGRVLRRLGDDAASVTVAWNDDLTTLVVSGGFIGKLELAFSEPTFSLEASRRPTSRPDLMALIAAELLTSENLGEASGVLDFFSFGAECTMGCMSLTTATGGVYQCFVNPTGAFSARSYQIVAGIPGLAEHAFYELPCWMLQVYQNGPSGRTPRCAR